MLLLIGNSKAVIWYAILYLRECGVFSWPLNLIARNLFFCPHVVFIYFDLILCYLCQYASNETSTFIWDLDKEQLVNTIALSSDCNISAMVSLTFARQWQLFLSCLLLFFLAWLPAVIYYTMDSRDFLSIPQNLHANLRFMSVILLIYLLQAASQVHGGQFAAGFVDCSVRLYDVRTPEM